MAGETILTVVGNMVDDPTLRFTPNGAAVASFTIAATPRVYDKQASEWRDGDALFLRCSAWRQMAENVAESLERGMRVMVQGRLKQRSFDTRDGEKRTVIELDADEVAPSLKYATAKVNRGTRGFEGGQQRQAPAADPWGTTPASTPAFSAPAANPDPWATTSSTDEPPF